MIDDLTALSDALDDPDVNLPAAVSVLAGHLRVAVPSFIGLTVMVHVADCPIVISGGDVGEAAAVHGSLLLSLTPLGAATTTGSIAFYSGIPGVFLTLAVAPSLPPAGKSLPRFRRDHGATARPAGPRIAATLWGSTLFQRQAKQYSVFR
ncbi:hypothetical protein ACVBEQ_02405 [Nakamurella sp. GG22]